MKLFIKTRIFFIAILSLLAISTFYSCGDDDNPNNSNEFTRASNPSFRLNLTLGTNAALRFNGGFRFVPPREARGSIAGVFIRRVTASDFRVFELSEPNNVPGACSAPDLEDSIILVYECGDKTSKYNTTDGNKLEGEGQFALKFFNATLNGDILIIN